MGIKKKKSKDLSLEAKFRPDALQFLEDNVGGIWSRGTYKQDRSEATDLVCEDSRTSGMRVRAYKPRLGHNEDPIKSYNRQFNLYRGEITFRSQLKSGRPTEVDKYDKLSYTIYMIASQNQKEVVQYIILDMDAFRWARLFGIVIPSDKLTNRTSDRSRFEVFKIKSLHSVGIVISYWAKDGKRIEEL